MKGEELCARIQKSFHRAGKAGRLSLSVLEKTCIIDSISLAIRKGEGWAVRELRTEAKTENLAQVLGFVDGCLEEAGCPMRTQLQIDVAVEELFVNIASYAYPEGAGEAVIAMEIAGDPPEAVIQFRDHGVFFDPLDKPDPDVTLPASERQIGGLGIYMVKQSMDDIAYRREDDRNILTIRKRL